MTAHTQSFTSNGTFGPIANVVSVAVFAYGGVGTGHGGVAAGYISMTATDTLTITVGGNGTVSGGGSGYHPGGAGGTNGGTTGLGGHGGGGSTGVVKSGTLMLEAGGGGGAGGDALTSSGYYGGGGGAGGQYPTAGGSGTGMSASDGGGGGGSGNGVNGAGGTGGTTPSAGNGSPGSAGSAGNGGAGGNAAVYVYDGGGGGGGGGYWGGGGGGGGGGTGGGGGGGGGACYAAPAVISPSFGLGGSTGYGSVQVNYTTADAPLTPTLGSPSSGAYVDAVGAITFTWTYNQGTDSGTQTAFALRRKIGVGAYGYWNGTNFSSTTPVWNTSTAQSVTIPASVFADGNAYNWSVATQESHYSLQSGFATDSLFNAQAVPTCNITAPTGSIATTSPAVLWTNTTPAGAVQTAYRVRIFDSTNTTQLWDSGTVMSNATGISVPTGLLGNGSYNARLVITETGGQSSVEDVQAFTIAALVPNAPTLTVAQDSGFWGVPALAVTIQGHDNVLSVDDASSEVGTGTLAALLYCTIARSSAQALSGSWSIAMTGTGSGDAYMTGPTVPVTPGDTWTSQGAFRAATTGRQVQVGVIWWSGGTSLGNGYGTAVNDTTTGWTVASYTGVVPAGATGVQPFYVIKAIATSEVHYCDERGLTPGAMQAWSQGGFVPNASFRIIRNRDGNGITSSFFPATWYDLSQKFTVYDLEAPDGYAQYYTGSIVSLDPSGNVVTSGVTTSTPVAVNLTQWDISDPINGNGALSFYRASYMSGTLASGGQASITIDREETQGVFRPLGRTDYLVTHGDLLDEEFDLAIVFLNQSDWDTFNGLRSLQTPLQVRSDLGDLYWVNLGAARPGVMARADRTAPGGPMRQLTMHCYPASRPT